MATFNLCPTVKIGSITNCFKCTKKERRNSTVDENINLDNSVVMINNALSVPDIEILRKPKFKSFEILIESDNFITDCFIMITFLGDIIHHHGNNSKIFVGNEKNVISFWKEKITALYIIYKHTKEKKKEQIVVKFPNGEKYRLNSNFTTDKKTEEINMIIITITKETLDEDDIIAGLAI